MAPRKDGGVVDGRGHVYGVKNLLVADCSIAPTTTDGACMPMAYMIGTNIAFQILKKESTQSANFLMSKRIGGNVFSSIARCRSSHEGSFKALPRWAASSSTAKPGGIVAISNNTPPGSLKYIE